VRRRRRPPRGRPRPRSHDLAGDIAVCQEPAFRYHSCQWLVYVV
jgi:hypothetical protein